MTAKDALDIIIKATAVVPLDRANHKLLEQALAAIEQLVSAQPAPGGKE